MKTTSAPSLLGPVLSLLLAGSRLAAAARDRVSVTHDDTTFLVDRHDDGRDTPYHVTFLEPFKSVYKFDARGYVTGIKADDETYEVSYRGNGNLKNVKDTASVGRRYLSAAEEQEAEEKFEAGVGGSGGGVGRGGSTASAEGEILEEGEQEERSKERSAPAGTTSHRGRRRRLYDCVDCEQTWDTLCDQGLDTVCNLEDYGSPFESNAEVSIRLFCDNFSSVCARFSASDVCDGECEEEVEEECLSPFTITLEWSGGEGSGEDDGLDEALDLYIIEPAGTTVYWNNWRSANGGLYKEDYKKTYTVSEGLNPTYSTGTTSGFGSGAVSEGMEVVEASGSYIAFVEWWSGDAPIYWTMTATSGSGEVLVEVDGQFTGDCGSSSTSAESTYFDDANAHGVSKLVYITLEEYVDNGCEMA